MATFGSDGRLVELMGADGVKHQFADGVGNERLVCVVFPSGAETHYSGAQGEEYRVSKDFPGMGAYIFDGPINKDRVVSVVHEKGKE
jgi:hypothetical protein